MQPLLLRVKVALAVLGAVNKTKLEALKAQRILELFRFPLNYSGFDRFNFCNSANYRLEHIEHKDLSRQIYTWLFWVIDNPISWLKSLIELAQTGKFPTELED